MLCFALTGSAPNAPVATIETRPTCIIGPASFLPNGILGNVVEGLAFLLTMTNCGDKCLMLDSEMILGLEPEIPLLIYVTFYRYK